MTTEPQIYQGDAGDEKPDLTPVTIQTDTVRHTGAETRYFARIFQAETGELLTTLLDLTGTDEPTLHEMVEELCEAKNYAITAWSAVVMTGAGRNA